MRILPKILIILCLLNYSYFSFSQSNNKIDSLVEALSIPQHDTSRIELFINISNEIEIEDSIRKLAYADSAIVLSENIQIKKHEALAKMNKAKLFESYKKYKEAIALYKLAIPIFKDLDDISGIFDIKLQLGDIYYKLNEFQKSTDLHLQSLEASIYIKDTTKIVQSEMNVALMYWRMGNLIDAEKHYLISLELSDKINYKTAFNSSLNSLGAIYWGYGKFNTAFKYYKKALDFSIKTGNDKKYVLVINNIGLIYQEWGKYETAMEHYLDGKQVAIKENYIYGLAYSYINIGKIQLLKNEYKEALISFDSALINYKKISRKMGIAYTFRYIGDAYFGMKALDQAIKYYRLSVYTAQQIDSKQHLAQALNSLANAYFENKNYSLSAESVNKSLSISNEKYYQDISKDNYFLLSKLAKISGSYLNALVYYQKASVLKDSIFNEKNSKQIAEMQTKYETEKKEQENIALRKEEQLKNSQLKANKVKIQNQYILIFAFAALLILFIVFSFILNKNRNNLLKSKSLLTKQNKEINIQKEELYAQSENLKEANTELQKVTNFKNKMFSIIGHDLRGPVGTISSILSLAMDNTLDEAKRQQLLLLTRDNAVATFTLLENLLIWANSEQGEIKMDIKSLYLTKIIDNSINLLKGNADKKNITITVEIEEDILVLADNNTLDTIFRNLISNAIKFSHENSKITISAQNMHDYIEISITDTGVGMSDEERKMILDTEKYYFNLGTMGEKGSGLGLQLCFEFIKKNNGSYQVISEKREGSQFIFTLPKPI